MTSTDAALGLFTAFNGVRVFAYVPQIIKICRDRQGAAAISYTTWLMFALSHATTVVYALFAVGDTALAVIFGVNTAFCAAIILLTMRQRRRFRAAQAGPPEIGGRAGRLIERPR